MVMKTDFHVFQLKFPVCNFKQAVFHLKLRDLDNTKLLLYKHFVRYLVVKSACALCKCSLESLGIIHGVT